MGERIQQPDRRGRFRGLRAFQNSFSDQARLSHLSHFVSAPLEAEAAEFVLVCVRLRVTHVSSERRTMLSHRPRCC